MFKLVSQKVKKLNRTMGYLSIPREDIGKELIPISQEQLEWLIGRKLKDFEIEIKKK